MSGRATLPVAGVLAALLGAVPGVVPGDVRAADGEVPSAEPLSFGFLDEVPGERVSIGRSRLHLHCLGEPGQGTVLFEAGMGGNALEWQPVRTLLVERLGDSVRTCSYDRAGYGWSDPVAGPRDAARLAQDLDTLLERSGIDGPLVVVAHSFGGFVARLLTGLRGGNIDGLVLIDTSHERQFERLAAAGSRPMLPGGGQFVLSMPEVPDNLPDEVRHKIAAFGRMRKSYAATHGEMAQFARSALQVRTAREANLVAWRMPLVVVRRGRRLYGDDAVGRDKDAGWAELQEDLVRLSERGRVVVARTSGHHVHVDQPRLVADIIAELIERRDARPSPAPAVDGDD